MPAAYSSFFFSFTPRTYRVKFKSWQKGTPTVYRLLFQCSSVHLTLASQSTHFLPPTLWGRVWSMANKSYKSLFGDPSERHSSSNNAERGDPLLAFRPPPPCSDPVGMKFPKLPGKFFTRWNFFVVCSDEMSFQAFCCLPSTAAVAAAGDLVQFSTCLLSMFCHLVPSNVCKNPFGLPPSSIYLLT